MLEGRTAVVTGASKGIGLAIVQALVEAGAHVVAGARSSSAAIDELVAAGSVTFVPVDLSQVDAPAALVAAAGGRVDILVNNVGAATTRLEGFLSVTDDQWLQSINLNLMATVRTTRAVLPLMIGARSGAIVNIASVNSTLPDPAVIDYSAAKGAQLNFAKSLSKEVGQYGIRVNSVSPGPVETDLWLGVGGVAATISAASGQDAAAVVSSAVADSATRRFTHPAEVADVVLFLADGRAANITGANITIDGGLISTL
ncbi:SDR family NAD(P)-dependent oxidoreductase [Subtercola sp. YIM 133946]|uniref:SDR family NAD(P)-dependent oxidoreductase n=1 Tax=Subtercola sp. YIM 133946 TaxID=3118909 RepID=UPI002F94F34C